MSIAISFEFVSGECVAALPNHMDEWVCCIDVHQSAASPECRFRPFDQNQLGSFLSMHHHERSSDGRR